VTADQLLTYLAWAIFLIIFVAVAIQAIRRPSRAHLDIALLFGAPAIVIAIAIATQSRLLPSSGIGSYIASSAILALPYLLVRLLDNIAVIALPLRRSIEALLIVALCCIWLLPLNRPQWVNSLLLLYVISVLAYVVIASIRATMQARGVTRRRLAAMSAGSLFLVFNLGISSLGSWFPQQAELWRGIAEVLGLVAGISYLIGFTPPRWLRQAWQGPELRAFLGRAAVLPRLQDTAAIVDALQQGAAESVGIAQASIGLWDETAQVLCFDRNARLLSIVADAETPEVSAFRQQQPLFAAHIHTTHPPSKASQSAAGSSMVLAAPITAGTRRLGVLVAYAPRAPIFAEDDLALMQLLADQAAVILESRALIDAAARIHGREEAARLKEDFLSAAAHDLKTPLTTLVARVQLMERRAQRDPNAPADPISLRLLSSEVERLKRLVMDLLDAARVEQGQLVGLREKVDLVAVAQEICARLSTTRHPCTIEGDTEVVGYYDGQRIAQLLDNLVENAIKYSPDGGAIQITIRCDSSIVSISVTDHGIGIPASDIPHLFTRFHRGTNVDDRRFPGMGLGLFICKGIVEQHEGQMMIKSQPGQGSTFDVRLPFVPNEVATYVT
jgi:signal transduction histidine kinase